MRVAVGQQCLAMLGQRGEGQLIAQHQRAGQRDQRDHEDRQAPHQRRARAGLGLSHAHLSLTRTPATWPASPAENSHFTRR